VAQILKFTSPDSHPAAGKCQDRFGQALIPDLGIEVRRDDLNDDEHRDRKRGQDDGGGASLRRQCSYLAAHLETLANDTGKILQDLAEIAAGRTLNGHSRHEQRQIVLTYSAVQAAQSGFEIRPIGNLVNDDSELAADRIAHLTRDHCDCYRDGMARAQAAYDHVQPVRKWRPEGLLPPPRRNRNTR
jgi:hypothetical protein